MNERIYMSSPDVGQQEEDAVVAAIRSGWIAPLGPDVDAFEAEMAARIGAQHAVALSSGTAALHLALVARGIGAGDVVLTSTMTFAATANAIVYTGAEPFFIDCDLETGNMDPELLEQALVDCRRRGDRVAAIMPVDLLGKTVDYTAIGEIADRHGVRLIADAAESLGAFHRGRPAGSFGESSAFSFNGNKVMTTSGGGMLMTDDGELAHRVRYLATQARQPVAHYEHTDIGFNYRMSNLLAALGRAQLARLDEMLERRREVRGLYRAFFRNFDGVRIFDGGDDSEDNCWLTSILVDEGETTWSTSELSSWLAAEDIESRPLWKPMHLQPVFAGARSLVVGRADRLFATGLTLPSGSALSAGQRERVLDSIGRFLESRGIPRR